MFYWLIQCFVFIFYTLDFVLFTLTMYALSFLPTRLTHHFYPRLGQAWAGAFIRFFRVMLRVHQQYETSLPEQAIYIANHPSAFEDIGMMRLFKARFLAKAELKKWWIFGRISTACGQIYVEREDKADRAQAKAALKTALEAGHNIGVYPEGGCHGRRLHLPFHYGVFELAKQTNVPLVPVFIHYEAQADFEWRDCHLLQQIWKMIRARNKVVHFYIFDPIIPTHFPDKETLCQHIQTQYLRWQEKYLI